VSGITVNKTVLNGKVKLPKTLANINKNTNEKISSVYYDDLYR
jgi:hypothetical protein